MAMALIAKRRTGKSLGRVAVFCGALSLCLAVARSQPTEVASGVARAVTSGGAGAHWRELIQEPNLPLRFEPNVGQAASSVRYLARGNGYRIDLSERGVKLDLGTEPASVAAPDGRGHVSPPPREASVGFRFVHSSRHPRLEPERPETSTSNYFLGNDPSRWRRHVANFGAVRYHEIYPGVDWVLYGNPGEVEYDFIVAPGVKPSQIELAIDGPGRPTLDSHGDLLIKVAGRMVRQRKPLAYQTAAAGNRDYVEAHYVLDRRYVRVSLGHYDRRRPLIIDPALAFSTYLGGSTGEYATAVAVDADGNVYVTGPTSSTDFPTLNPVQATNKRGNIFISKLNAAGTGLIYSTYLGGSVNELAFAIAVDGAGDAYVGGSTSSPDFPVRNAFQRSYKGTGPASENGFIAKLDPTGGMLVYSTYLGGSVQDNVQGLAVDSTGSAYVVGDTSSADFPTANALQSTLKGRINAFISKLSPDGMSLMYSTYLGGSAADEANAIALDASGDAYIGGDTNSVDFPTVNPFQAVNHVSVNGSKASTGFVAKLNPAGSALTYSSYLGGSAFDVVSAIAVDNSGNAYVTGGTVSTDFPTANPFQNTNRAATGLGGGNAFVTKVNPTGGALVYSTYLGGSGGGNGALGDSALAIAVDSTGEAFVAGRSSSTDFPTVDAVQSSNKATAIGASNAFVSELNAAGNGLVFSTYLGGSGSLGNTQIHITIPFGDWAAGIVLDASGNIYIAGQAASGDFPTINAYQTKNKTATQYGTVQTAFVAKFGTEASPPPPPSGGGASGGGGSFGWDSMIGLALTLLFRRRGRGSGSDERERAWDALVG
jgi:hypothetical protein